jgi:hypothetical protein
MASNGFISPELSVVFLVPVKLSDIFKEPQVFSKVIKKIQEADQTFVQHCIPAEVTVEELEGLSEDLRIFHSSDEEYFDDSYLSLKRFCRVDLEDLQLTVYHHDRSQTVNAKPYLTLFDVGIAVYTLWVQNLQSLTKREIIDLCFLGKVQIQVNGGPQETLLSLFQQQLRLLLDLEDPVSTRDVLENHLCMLFVKDLPFTLPKTDGAQLPQAFLDQYKRDVFDIITLPERYFGISYDYHKSRTPEFIDHVLTNLSVRNDFPVFLFANRFLGVKIRTDKPDYGFNKRIIFNIVLYTNIVLQLLMLKEINQALMVIVKNLDKVTLGRLIKFRQAIYRYLEEYINTSIQRYEIWKIAVQDATKQLGIPEYYGAINERLEMLNSYLNSAYQRQSNIWFVILNTTFFFSTVFSYISFLLGRIILPVEFAILLVVGVLWLIAIGFYYRRYIR